MSDYKSFIKNQIAIDSIPEWNSIILCGSDYNPKRNQFLCEITKYYSNQYPNIYHIIDATESYIENADVLPTSELASLYNQIVTTYQKTKSLNGIVIVENQFSVFFNKNQKIITKYITNAGFIGIKVIIVMNTSILKPIHRHNVDLFITFDKTGTLTSNHLCSDLKLSGDTEKALMFKLHKHCQKKEDLYLVFNYKEKPVVSSDLIKVMNIKMKSKKEDANVQLELNYEQFDVSNRMLLEV